MIKENKMGTKKVFPLLMTMAFPPMLSMLVQSLYNIVDSIYVAQISENAITAVSLAFPIQNLILAVAVGTGVGMNSYISRKLGQKETEEANSAVAHGLILMLISSVIFAILAFIIIKPFFAFFTQSEEIRSMGNDYLLVIMLFSFAPLVHIAIEKVFQSTGQMMAPMIFQAVGCVVNIILDPIFIFVFKMGVQGAAIATVIGQLASMLLSIYWLKHHKIEVKLDIKHFHFNFNCIKQIYTVGIPSMCMTALGSVLVMGLNTLLVQFSNMAVSLFGIYFKLQTFVFMPVSGLTQGAMPIFGYNYGAGNKHRLIETLKFSIIVAFVINLLGTLLFFIFPELLLTMFKASPEMLEMGTLALRILCFCYIPATLGMVLPTLFQAMGKGMYSFVIFLTRQLIITLPLAYLLAPSMGVVGIWLSLPISEIIAAVLALVFYAHVHKKDPIFQETLTAQS